LLAIGLGKIVGSADCGGPVPAFAIGNSHDPCPGRLVASIAERQPKADLGKEDGLLRYR
jgi:hypothetical protein